MIWLIMGNSVNFKSEFKKLFNNFDKLDKNKCYIFEMISKDNRIVTKYDEEFIVLLGARASGSLSECNQISLDAAAKRLGVRRPKRFKATNIEECRKLFEDMNDDEEGLVVVDKKFNRFKLKQESYLKMARIISLKEQDILDYILGTTELDADFTDMPELKEKEEYVASVLGEVGDYIVNVYNNLKHIREQKDFASHAIKYNFSSVLFGLRKGHLLENLLTKWVRVIKYHNTMVIPTIKKIIILRGIPGSGKSTWVKEQNLGQYVLSMDTLRLMFEAPSPRISQEYNGRVYSIFMEMLEQRMSAGSFTIIDAVHATKKYVDGYNDLCEKYGYEKQVITFEITLAEALNRNRYRQTYKQVPEEVIERMYNQLNTNVYKP